MIMLFIKKIIDEFGQNSFNYKECFEVITSFNKYPYIFITGFYIILECIYIILCFGLVLRE